MISAEPAGDLAQRWFADGSLTLRTFFDPSRLEAPLEAARAALADRGSRAAGTRDALRSPALRDLAGAAPIADLARTLCGSDAFVTRAILFDKSPSTNWDVAWHQDTTIAVEKRLEVPGFGPWSIKAGVPHVQPPAEVLAGIATIRIHLDPCGPDNGALLVVPGSHRRGILADIDGAECDRLATCCPVEAGGVVALRPLTLHASRKSAAPAHRRVLHLEFARDPLPGGLHWARA